MIYYVVDIETIAHPEAHRWLDPVKPDGRLVDPEKIEESIRDKTEARNDSLALHPDTNRIVALGYHVVGHLDPQCLVMRDEFEEREQLQKFWDAYRAGEKRNTVAFVTFNGLAFDLPTLLARSMYLQCDYDEIELDKYRSLHAKFDLMWRLSRKGAVKAHSLKFYARRFGLDLLDKVNGAQIAALVAQEDWAAVEAHCLSDVGLTHAIANRMGLLRL